MKNNVFRIQSYRRLWLGQSISQIGDYVAATTLALWIGAGLLADRPFAPAVSGLTLIAGAVVPVVGAPLAGVLVDRWDKVKVALVADGARAITSCGLAMTAMLYRVMPLWLTLAVCLLVLVAQAVAALFFNPAMLVIVGDAVPADRRGQAASFAQASSAVAMMVGPMAASMIYVGTGPALAFAVNALSFLCSFTAIYSVRRSVIPAILEGGQQARRQTVVRELLVPLRLIGGHRVLRTVLAAGMLVMLGAGALSTLDVYFVRENLHATPEWFGAISAALGSGILAGAIAVGFVGDRFGYHAVFAAGLLLCGLAYVGYARSTAALAATALIFVYGVAAGAVETAISPLLLDSVRREHLGRVLSIFTPAFRLASIVSLAVAGWAASLAPPFHRFHLLGIEFGRIDLVFVCSGLLFVTSGVYATVAMSGRRLTGLAGPASADA